MIVRLQVFLEPVLGGARVLKIPNLEHRHADLLAQDFELFSSGGTLRVRRDQKHATAFGFVQAGELAGGGRLARTLQTDHEPDVAFSLQGWLGCLSTEGLNQFVINKLDDLLPWCQGTEHVRADGLLLNFGDEILGDGEIDIRLEQRHPNFTHGGFDIVLGDLALITQTIEDALKFVAKILEHELILRGRRDRGRKSHTVATSRVTRCTALEPSLNRFAPRAQKQLTRRVRSPCIDEGTLLSYFDRHDLVLQLSALEVDHEQLTLLAAHEFFAER